MLREDQTHIYTHREYCSNFKISAENENWLCHVLQMEGVETSTEREELQ